MVSYHSRATCARPGIQFQLVELGIARELTGKRRNRLFAYEAYVATLSEGTEPL